MNWYKIAQRYAPIAITSYNSYQELGIAFEGGTKYTYERINIDDYGHLKSLLDNKNYKEAQILISSWSPKNEETEEDRQGMLSELLDRGYLK